MIEYSDNNENLIRELKLRNAALQRVVDAVIARTKAWELLAAAKTDDDVVANRNLTDAEFEYIRALAALEGK